MTDTRQTGSGLPRDPRVRFHFRQPAFEFFFQWLAGAQTHGASEAGESFYAAARIRERDLESWIGEWTAMARRVEARAEHSLEGGHRVSAREAFLRSYTYYRAPLAFISPLREPVRYREQYEQARACFRRAAPLLDPPLEPVAVPFEGDTLPGYFAHPPGAAKTLIMIGGGDTFVEDLYAYIGPAAARRGYNLLTVDLPGQGVLPFDGRIWRSDAETPMAAVLDWLLARPEVDPATVAAFGLSAGGYLVPRALTKEKRIKAGVACCVILDFPRIWSKRGLDAFRRAERSPLWALIMRLRARRRPGVFTLLDTYLWRWGAKTVPDLAEVTRDSVVDPRLITCPMLNLVAAQEYASPDIRRFAQRAEEQISHPAKRTVITPENEGAGTHGVGTNLSLMSQIVFDWLDEVLRPDTALATAAGENTAARFVDRSG